MLKDLTGLDNGYFTVDSFAELSPKRKDGKRSRTWNVICRCSNKVVLTTYQFNSKKPRSCGCYQQRREGNKTNHRYHTKHGLANKHPLYSTWRNMKQRCYNPNNQDYNYYGGKGIKLCDEWVNDSGAFMAWGMSHGWEKFLVIDRIDPTDNYSPVNCRFITMSENSRRIVLPIGSKRPAAILNEEQVRDIKKRLASGERSYLIARSYGINSNIVYQIKKGKTWKHVIYTPDTSVLTKNF